MVEGKIAILGGRGMLGTDLAYKCKEQGIDCEVFDLPDFDITNTNQLQEALCNVQIVVNCAAYTNVDKAESQANLAYKINAEAVGRLGAVAKNIGIWVVHISTDFVFDGKSAHSYVETDTPKPINTYGKSKLAGEQLLIKSGCNYCIVRVQWTYGLGGNCFITKLISLAKQNKELMVIDDQIGSPTATTEVANVICKLLQIKPGGLFHFANTGYASRFDIAAFIFDKLNMDIKLKRCKNKDYKTAAARPLNSRFCCDKIQSLLNEPIEPWQKPLEKFLRQL